MNVRTLLSIALVCLTAAFAAAQDGAEPPQASLPADVEQAAAFPAHSKAAQADLGIVRERLMQAAELRDDLEGRRNDLQTVLDDLDKKHEELRQAYAGQGDGPPPLDDDTARERLVDLFALIEAADDESLASADRREREDLSQSLARARSRDARLKERYATWRGEARTLTNDDETWALQEPLWDALENAHREAVAELLRLRIEAASLAGQRRTIDAQIDTRRRATMVLLTRENLLLRSASVITVEAVSEGLDDLVLLPEWLESAAISAGEFVSAPENVADVGLLIGAAAGVVFLLLYLIRKTRARRRPKDDLNTDADRVSDLSWHICGTLLFSGALAAPFVLAGVLLDGLRANTARAWITIGIVLGVAWFVRGAMIRLLPTRDRWTPIRLDAASVSMMRAGVRMLFFGTLLFVPACILLRYLGYANDGAREALWATYKVFAVFVFVVFILRKGLIGGLIREPQSGVGRFVRWAAAFVRPLLIIAAPLLLALDLLGYDLLASVLARIGGGLACGIVVAIALDRAVWSGLSAWMRSAFAPDENLGPAERETAEAELTAGLAIGRYVVRIATIVAGILAMTVIQGIGLDTWREFLDDALPFQSNVEGRKITWWGLIIGGALLLLVLTSVSKVKLVLEHFVLPRTSMETSLRYTISTLAGYVIAAVGLYVGLTQIFDLSSLGFIFAALSVGIGFGLQEIVANFISGLILLFERPIKVGDIITVGTTMGVVQKINIRATRIQTFDNISMLIPNKDFITQAVVNSVYNDTIVRVRVPVGVAYGSDLELVRRVLVKVGTDHPKRLQNRPAEIMFLGFGASSLDFDLRVWVGNADDQYRVASDLRFQIDAAFREHDIEIPFAQRDLHLRSVDPDAAKDLLGLADRDAATEARTVDPPGPA